ncbi:ABC transporter permease [Candidatus Saccharibacteria bacterium TM7i]|nr:ABC transporter permease [Candidatus Saccharibacteria bacterium TM7i]
MKTAQQMKRYIKRHPLAAKLSLALVGVIGLQVALATAYLVAFHDPTPREIPVAIVSADATVKDSFRDAMKDTFAVREVDSIEAARDELKQKEIYAIYKPTPLQSNVVIATALDKKIADAAKASMSTFDAQYQQNVVAMMAKQNPQAPAQAKAPLVDDAIPLVENDATGSGLFYVAFSFVFGGYLAAVAISTVRGDSKLTRRRVLARVAGLTLFSLAGALFVTLIAVHGVKVLPSAVFWATWGIGALATLGVSLLASALISVLGTIGTGLVIILFVILGTPASGGPLPVLFMDGGIWSWLSTLLPTGQTMEAIRSAAYLEGAGVWWHLLVLAGYVIIGAGVLVLYGMRHRSFEAIE